jgi:hypothetical protein
MGRGHARSAHGGEIASWCGREHINARGGNIDSGIRKVGDLKPIGGFAQCTNGDNTGTCGGWSDGDFISRSFTFITEVSPFFYSF